jgi:hypothetical protein
MQTVTKLPEGVATFKGYKDGYELWRVEKESGVQGGYDSAFLEPNYKIKLASPKNIIGSFTPIAAPILPEIPPSQSDEGGKVKTDVDTKVIYKSQVKNSTTESNRISKKMNEDYFDYKFLIICFAILLIVIVKRT